MNRSGYILSFIFGAAVGSVATWKLLKTKYEQIAQEEIDSVKEVFSRKEKEAETVEEEETEDRFIETSSHMEAKPSLSEYASKIADLNYNNKKEDSEEMSKNVPYVISPDEFGEDPNYETVSLTYYADGVLTDDFDNIIDDVDELVGEDSLTHFGEYEDDSVFVRDDDKKVDYEILKDSRRFDAVYPMEG